MGTAVKAYQAPSGKVTPASPYITPDGRAIEVISNAAILFSDDFGGAAVDTAVRWNVIDGGLPANPVLNGQTLAQAKIGSGITGITDAVTASALVVTMGTTLGAERWYLSQQMFAGMEDLFWTAIRSQALAANSIWIGLVEVDPATGIPMLNPNIAADGNGSSYFTNMGGAELGQTTVAAAFACNAIGDSSSAIATGSTGTALAALTTNSEFLAEFHAEELIVSNGAVDSSAAKATTPSRVSSQIPNDGKAYKLLMRFRNLTAPGSSTTVTIGRIMLWDSQELRVEVASGRGDSNGQKALAVNIATQGALVAGQTVIGSLGGAVGTLATGSLTAHKLISAASTNATLVKSGAGRLYGGLLCNTSASWRYFKIFNKTAAAPIIGTDVPVATIGIPPGQAISVATALACDIGYYLSSGSGYVITGAAADADATAIAAGDVIVLLLYT